jgi:hypothetical protein
MTTEKLIEILSLQPADIVKELQISSYVGLPKWSDLVKEYDPMKHNIWDSTKYPAKLNEVNQDDFKRTSLALQKLAVNRIAQSMFSTPVQRNYKYDKDSDSAQQAVNVLEEIYGIKNYIDSENIERCKKLNASCQIATVWRAQELPTIIGEETSKFTLSHKTYSEMDGYQLYPINDSFGGLLCISIGYTDTDNVEHMHIYINIPDKAEYRHYMKTGEWILDTENSNSKLEVFPVVYMNIEEPVWGGSAGTVLVEQLEEMESYQGLYIKRNALPTFTLDYGEIEAGKKSTTEETSNDARRVILVGKGGIMQDVTWEGAGKSVNERYQRLRNAFFEQIQVPDTSFANMIQSNTSAENKELIFADAKAKARDLGGEWEKMFYNELEIVKKFVSVMFSSYAKELEIISVKSVIQPYSIKTKKENAEYVALAGNAMSTDTKVRVLNEVDDVQAEVDLIEGALSAEANQQIL